MTIEARILGLEFMMAYVMCWAPGFPLTVNSQSNLLGVIAQGPYAPSWLACFWFRSW